MKRAVPRAGWVGLLVAVGVARAGAEPAPPRLRLPDGARPIRQTVELHLDPNRETFDGVVDIDLDLRSATRMLWLNATELTVHQAGLKVGGRERTARVIPGGESFVGLELDSPAGPGAASLHLSYEGKVSRKENEGVFAQKEGGDWYVFTQFEPIAARRAFPSFDEPSFKIPWRVTLRVPRDLVALSNAPVTSTRQELDGTKTVTFAETKPLPSYLVAVAVGAFDVVDAGSTGRKATQVRIVVPRGRGKDARWAVESTGKILALLEDYFDRPYPYEKLDQVAIPGVGFAMEHPGLVTYGQGLMVQRPEEETIDNRRGYASVCAHELAHQWFGDLVTMSWWDDTWLNEAFASWLGEKITDRFHPDWDVKISRVRSRSRALGVDSLATARKIRQPIESEHDIHNVFDGITYSKGEAVLEMFESWLGEEVFRKGVQSHLDSHAWGNATSGDFLAAVSAAAGRDVATPFQTFLDQTGAPLLAVTIQCTGQPTAILSQRPYRRLGSPSVSKTWQIPVCVKHGASSADARDCTLLTQASSELRLAAPCAQWAFPNAGMAGYYRAVMTREEMERVLQKDRLDASERVGLLGDVQALVASGDLTAADALALAASQAGDPNRHVVDASRSVVESVRDHVPEALRPRYGAFLRELFGSRARALGWGAKPGEDEDTRLLRHSLMWTVAGLGEDAALGKEAVALAQRWLDDGRAVDPDMVDVVLRVAARQNDRALYGRLEAEALKTGDREQRERLLEALGSFLDQAIVRSALGLALNDRIDPRESIGVVFEAAGDPRTQPLAYQFVKDNKEALLRRLPREYGAYFPAVGRRFCDEERKADLIASFKAQADRFPGGPRALDQVIESVDLCIAERRVVQPSVAAFLEKR